MMAMPTFLRHRVPRSGPPRGATSLVVVMVMLFIVAMVAAYASRNLVFEQRTSANQYRGTLAFEAADAGVEWAITRLNDSRMDNACRPLAAAAIDPTTPQPSFRERYLAIDPTSGMITPVAGRLAGCVFDGSDWSCDCPESGNPNPTFVARGDGPYVAFWVRFSVPPNVRPGIVRVEVNGCTRNDADCLRFDRQSQFGDGLAAHNAQLVLRSALGSVPVAAVTARGSVGLAGGSPTLRITNDAPTGRGITVHAGATFNAPGAVLNTIPGTPAARSVLTADAGLALADLSPPLVPSTPANFGVDRMFQRVFGVWPATFAEATGVVVVPCAPCSAADVNQAVRMPPGHAVMLDGAGPLTIDADIGSATNPVAIVAGGSVRFGGAPVIVHGLVYSRAATWTTAGIGTIRGAAVAEGDLEAGGPLEVVHDSDLLTRLRVSTGTFVRSPGGWRDTAP